MTPDDRGQNKAGGIATRDAILDFQDLSTRDVAVPEWGGLVVRVRELTGTERGDFQAAISTVTTEPGGESRVEFDAHNLQVQLCAMTIVDENGDRLFKNSEVDMLGRKSARALQRVFEASSQLSGIAEDSVEEAAEKSEAVPSGG